MNCSYCSLNFTSKRGLTMHINRNHPNEQEDKPSCEHCKKIFESTYTCKKHMLTCKPNESEEKEEKNCCLICNKQFSKNYNLQRHEKNCKRAKEAIISLKTKINVLESKSTTPPVVYNITNNNNTTNNNNSTNSISNTKNTMNNNVFMSNLEKLVPVTESFILKILSEVITTAKDKNHLLTSEKMFSEKLSLPLSNSLLCTDKSRGVVHWKDGDNDNQHIRDTQCAELSNKIRRALNNNPNNEIDEYATWTKERLYEFEEDDPYMSLFDTVKTISAIAKGHQETIEKLCNLISKRAPTADNKKTQNKSSDQKIEEKTCSQEEQKNNPETLKLTRLKKILSIYYNARPYLIYIQNAEGVGTSLNRFLDPLGFAVSHDIITLKDDDKKDVHIKREEFLEMIKAWLRELGDPSFCINYMLHSSNIEMFEDQIEDEKEAKVNFKIFYKWLYDEMSEEEQEIFDNKVFLMLSIKC